MKKIVWMLVSCLMVLSLVVASCGPEEEEEEEEVGGAAVTVTGEEEEVEEEVVAPSPEVPQYGGTITLAIGGEYWDLLALGHGFPQYLSHDHLWNGDWAKGPAGGYGTNECLWDDSINIPSLYTGFLAESWRYEVDSEAGTVTTIFQIRQGVHWANVDSEAGRLVNGRELTAADVVWNLDQLNNNPDAMNYNFAFSCRGIHPVQTGPWEVSITHPLSEHLANIMRMVNNSLMFPPELYETYGFELSCTNWRYDVGTGPYIITDSVPENMTTLVRNPAYWKTDPVGLGKGNQLPYIETVKATVIPDRSTQQAALRTGNVDQLGGFNLEDKDLMLQQRPELKWAMRGSSYQQPAYMRMDDPELPTYKLEVRRAVMMAIDLDEINQGLYAGLGKYPSWPYYYTPAYADLYMGLDDPTCPDTVRELFTYNPDKAKELLAEAGYPSGTRIKVELTCTQADVDYYSIVLDYLSKVGIDLEFNILTDFAAIMGVGQNREYEWIIPGVSPPSTYPEQYQYTSGWYLNGSALDDPYVNEMADKARMAAITDINAAMVITKELMPYLQDLALVIQTPRYPLYNLWWPWLKNYSGESSVGYFFEPYVPYVWIDQDLKKSMGY